MAKLVYRRFLSNGSWVAPAGITRVLLIGQGGGMGGGGGSPASFSAGLGGNGTLPFMTQVSVVPNTSYAVTIGTGGAGGAARASGAAHNRTVGVATTFGALATFPGATASQQLHVAMADTSSGTLAGQTSAICTGFHSYYPAKYKTQTNGRGGNQILASSIYYSGGQGGLGGYYGSLPGLGGDGVGTGTAEAGAAATGVGAGGGGGGSGPTSAAGGAGAPGQLFVIWVE